MKKIFIITAVFLLSIDTSFGSIPTEVLKRLRGLYPDQSESFLLLRWQNADDLLEKWRSFSPYYYQLLSRMDLPPFLSERRGLCAGDPHMENFGFLFHQNPVFTLNDLDDVSPCSLNADALRLYVGHLFVQDVDPATWLSAYRRGLGGEVDALPNVLKKMSQESAAEGRALPEKLRKMAAKGVCKGKYSAVTEEENSLIENYVSGIKAEYVHSCAYRKEKGGSAGSLRYLIFATSTQGDLEAFELKELRTPAPMFSEAPTLPRRKEIFREAVIRFLGEGFSEDYFAVTFMGRPFQRRPVLEGNIGVKVDELAVTEREAVVYHEALQLGILHASTNQQAFEIKASDFAVLAKRVKDTFSSEMGDR